MVTIGDHGNVQQIRTRPSQPRGGADNPKNFRAWAAPHGEVPLCTRAHNYCPWRVR